MTTLDLADQGWTPLSDDDHPLWRDPSGRILARSRAGGTVLTFWSRRHDGGLTETRSLPDPGVASDVRDGFAVPLKASDLRFRTTFPTRAAGRIQSRPGHGLFIDHAEDAVAALGKHLERSLDAAPLGPAPERIPDEADARRLPRRSPLEDRLTTIWRGVWLVVLVGTLASWNGLLPEAQAATWPTLLLLLALTATAREAWTEAVGSRLPDLQLLISTGLVLATGACSNLMTPEHVSTVLLLIALDGLPRFALRHRELREGTGTSVAQLIR